jgi:three-Cys-motif partner protein
MPPRETLWPLEPHTLGKHLVLRAYLHAWLPIMARANGRILFIDGFAGPGEYEAGEEGSPVIALRSLLEHRARSSIGAEVRFFFIEKDPRRAAHLEALIVPWRPQLPPNCRADVREGAFDETMTQVLNGLDEAARQLAPSFVMVDPFGVAGTPMSVLQRILRNPKTELYVSFMYDFISRFRSTPEFEPHMDALFGTPMWRAGIDLVNPAERQMFFFSLYESQLRAAGAHHVVRLDLFEGGRLVYGIFFATNHWLGCDRMKQAIWSVAPFGDFAFRGTHSSQLILGLTNPDFRPLEAAISQQFGGAEWVTIDDILMFVGSDATDYHTGQLKRQVLIPMERAGRLEVDAQSRRKKCTYPEGTRLRFRAV